MYGPKFDDKRRAEIEAEVAVLTGVIAQAAERLTFDDEPAAFASLMEREEGKKK